VLAHLFSRLRDELSVKYARMTVPISSQLLDFSSPIAIDLSANWVRRLLNQQVFPRQHKKRITDRSLSTWSITWSITKEVSIGVSMGSEYGSEYGK
jgi:hypothetical protein